MPHLTFVHGIGNKTAPAEALKSWCDALRDADGVDLAAEGVTTSFGYWADLLYASPVTVPVRNEESTTELEAMTSGAGADLTMAWLADLPLDEQELVGRLAEHTGSTDAITDAIIDAPATRAAAVVTAREDPSGAGDGFERVPLPDWLKKSMMRVLLRDVHHYLFDAACTPRPGCTYQVRRDARAAVLRALGAGAATPGPHVVIAHSLGSVIAYDLLANVEDCPRVDTLITIGSPLGLDEVQDRLKPGWSRSNGFPGKRLGGQWFNFYDRLDPVCGFDPLLGNDFRRNGTHVVLDVHEPNYGAWRHAVAKYLAGRQLRETLIDSLDLG